MNPDQIRAIYDEDQRRSIVYPGVRCEATPHVIRHLDELGIINFVIYSQLTADNADEVIKGEVDYFTHLGQSFEWKLFSHDQPADLKERLAAHGFEIEEAEAIMVLPLAGAPPTLFDTGAHDIRRLTDPDNLGDILTIENAVWGNDATDWLEQLTNEMRIAPHLISIYGAYVDEQPASCGWMRLPENSQFASLWGGSTIEQYRGRGIYKALVAARAVEARERGINFLTVDASPMSRPILERLGFHTITWSHPCKYTVKSTAEN